MAQTLTDTNVAIFISPRGTEQVEFTEPKQAVSDAGATVDVVGSKTGEATTVNNDLDEGETFEVERSFSEISSDDYDAVIIPGGAVGADRLRTDEDAVALVQNHLKDNKPIGVICHGPWVLVEADVVDGRTLTSYPSLQTDIRNAGGEWIDEEVVTDGHLVTSRKPDDLPAFCETIVEEFASVRE